MGQHWEIRPDGTGQFTDTGPFGHPRSETRFEWRQAEDFLFELLLTEIIAFQQDYAPDLEDDERECAASPPTDTLDARSSRTDVGPESPTWYHRSPPIVRRGADRLSSLLVLTEGVTS